MTKTNTVGQVLGTPIVPPVEKFGVGYISGAKAAKPDIKVLSACHPGGLASGFTDPDWGKDDRQAEMSQNADVIFAAGGKRATAACWRSPTRAARCWASASTPTSTTSLPEAKAILVSSAMKLITPGVFNIVKAVQDGTSRAATSSATSAWRPTTTSTSKVPADVKMKMSQVTSDVAGAVGPRPAGTSQPANCPQVQVLG